MIWLFSVMMSFWVTLWALNLILSVEVDREGGCQAFVFSGFRVYILLCCVFYEVKMAPTTCIAMSSVNRLLTVCSDYLVMGIVSWLVEFHHKAACVQVTSV